MRIYVFEHNLVQLFILASTEAQARAIIGTHYSEDVARDAIDAGCGMSFVSYAKGNGEPFICTEPL